jgi:hypothetical protein
VLPWIAGLVLVAVGALICTASASAITCVSPPTEPGTVVNETRGCYEWDLPDGPAPGEHETGVGMAWQPYTEPHVYGIAGQRYDVWEAEATCPETATHCASTPAPEIEFTIVRLLGSIAYPEKVPFFSSEAKSMKTFTEEPAGEHEPFYTEEGGEEHREEEHHEESGDPASADSIVALPADVGEAVGELFTGSIGPIVGIFFGVLCVSVFLVMVRRLL